MQGICCVDTQQPGDVELASFGSIILAMLSLLVAAALSNI
jgi:hypothetical protein